MPVAGPHDLARTVGFLHAEDDPFLARRPAGRVEQAVRTSAGPCLVEVAPAAALSNGSRRRVVRIEARGPGRGLEEALAAGRRLAGLGAPGAEDAAGRFRRVAREHPVLRDALARQRGLRLGQRPDAVAVVTAAILAQQVTMSFARVMTRALWEAHGETVRMAGRRWRLPPPAERLARTTPAQLRPLKISGRKAEYVRDLCAAIANGDLRLERLAELDAEEATESLVRHRGVGPTTAAWILLFGAGHPDAWPPADVGLLAALEQDGSRPTPDEAEAWAHGLEGVRGLAALHLWASRR